MHVALHKRAGDESRLTSNTVAVLPRVLPSKAKNKLNCCCTAHRELNSDAGTRRRLEDVCNVDVVGVVGSSETGAGDDARAAADLGQSTFVEYHLFTDCRLVRSRRLD